ncbi:MAG: hypothetical protein LUO96_00215 [Methanomicrobiales archaeon]|nr:hypothetical protein [Methanomicrobiales archaeon]
MRDKTVQGIVNVIPLLIIIVAIILPLSAHGWDIERAAIPASPFPELGPGLLPETGGSGFVAPEGPVISVRGSGVTDDGSRVYLEVQLKNPMPVQVVVKEFSASAPLRGTSVNLALVAPVSIPSGGSGTIRLEATRPQALAAGGWPPSLSELRNLKMTLSSGGMDMTLDESTIRGMLS